MSRETVVLLGDIKRIHRIDASGSEVVEEFDLSRRHLVLRKHRVASVFGRVGDWEIDAGETAAGASSQVTSDDFKASMAGHFAVRIDSEQVIQLRVRNATFQRDVYDVSVGDDGCTIVIRTSNKKYFKRFSLPDVAEYGVRMSTSNLSVNLQFDTLIISYKKPEAMLAAEKAKMQKPVTIGR